MSWLKHGILNISDEASMADDGYRYKVMIYCVLIPGILFTTGLGIFAFSERESLLAILDISIALLLLVLFLFTRADLFLHSMAIILQAVLMLFFLTLFSLGLARNQSHLWYYVLPMMSFFFFGKRKGLILSLSIMGLSILIASLGDSLPFYSPYSPGLLVRFFMSYLVVVIMTYIFESTRQQTKNDLEAALEQLQKEAIEDGLTHLYNRRYMDSVLDLVLRQRQNEQAVAFLMADLDYFKQYNDIYGHQSGDQALQRFAELLQSHIRRKTDYAFRYGGEEFAVLLSFPTLETVESFSDGFIKAWESLNIPHEGSPLGMLSVSIGAAYFCCGRVVDEDVLIRTADEALYEAKKNGKNCYRIRGGEVNSSEF